jgi:hypothetical protein
LATIEAAIQRLESQAKAEAEAERKRRAEAEAERQRTGTKRHGRAPKEVDETPMVLAVIDMLISPPAWGQVAIPDTLIEFAETAETPPRQLHNNDAIAGTEWLSFGARFEGVNLHIRDDADCESCLFGADIVVTFEHNGFSAVTDHVHINYIFSSGAFTRVIDLHGEVLWEGAGDVTVIQPNIFRVEIQTAGFGMDAFRFNSPHIICDINRDGVLNLQDVRAVIRVLLGGGEVPPEDADCNGDGQITLADVRAVIRIMTGS